MVRSSSNMAVKGVEMVKGLSSWVASGYYLFKLDTTNWQCYSLQAHLGSGNFKYLLLGGVGGCEITLHIKLV